MPVPLTQNYYAFFFPDANKAVRPVVVVADMQKAAVSAFAAFTIASSVLTMPPAAEANMLPSSSFFPTQVLAEKVIREGVYGEYEIDLPEQKYDDARSTFKSAKETKTKKGMSICVCVFANRNTDDGGASLVSIPIHR